MQHVDQRDILFFSQKVVILYLMNLLKLDEFEVPELQVDDLIGRGLVLESPSGSAAIKVSRKNL